MVHTRKSHQVKATIRLRRPARLSFSDWLCRIRAATDSLQTKGRKRALQENWIWIASRTVGPTPQSTNIPEVSPSRPTRPPSSVGTNSLTSSYQVTNLLSTRQKLHWQVLLCQLFFLANHRIFEWPKTVQTAVEQTVENQYLISTLSAHKQTSGICIRVAVSAMWISNTE